MIRMMCWKPELRKVVEVPLSDLPANHAAIREGETWWIDLDTPTPAELSRVFPGLMSIHPLTLEDITKTTREPDAGAHLPKVEEFGDYLFAIVNPIPSHFGDYQNSRTSETPDRPQLSAVLSHLMLITHHVSELKCVESTWQYAMRHGECTHRGPDFLFHLILDAMVDEYAPVVDSISDRLDEMEIELFTRPQKHHLARLVRMKREVTFLRKTLIHEREVLARLIRGEFSLVTETEIVYYRNVYDHLVRYTELAENAREMVSDLMQTHLAAVSNRMNEIMKLLTMISTTILPMTLIAGVYGMNFKYMPELEWQWGYGVALGLMATTLALSLGFFRWKRWI
ncbi:MAG: magnesium/cobalt transporter CorA [Fimbriiglobus sp.]